MVTTPLFLDGLVKIDYAFEYSGREWHIIRWWKSQVSVGPISHAELVSIATAAQAAFSPLHAFTSQNNQFLSTTTTDFGSDTGLQATVFAGGFGSETSADVPIQVAVEIEWHILRRYRGGHPKTYISGLTAGQLDGPDTFLATFLTALSAAVNTYLAAMAVIDIVRGSTTFTGNFVNVSKFTAHAERLALVIDAIQSATVQPMTASQRRRRGRI